MPESLLIRAPGIALWRGRNYSCALGQGGIGTKNREGDGISPAGSWPLRRLLYRADRLPAPPCRLPMTAIAREDGWCDAPGDPLYNCPIRLPYPASAEGLWREDGVYDLIIPLGFNDDPVKDGLGSAIFIHVARPGFTPTAGCIAFARADLLELLPGFSTDTIAVIQP